MLKCGCGGSGSTELAELQEMTEHLAAERQALTEQHDCKLKQVTHLAEMVADLKLQLESLTKQYEFKTQLYGKRRIQKSPGIYQGPDLPNILRLILRLS